MQHLVWSMYSQIKNLVNKNLKKKKILSINLTKNFKTMLWPESAFKSRTRTIKLSPMLSMAHGRQQIIA
jgi:hypothetical protein